MSDSARKLQTVRSEEESPSESIRPDLRSLTQALIKYQASDLHLRVGRPPLYRINGKLIPARLPALTPDEVKALFVPVMSRTQWQQLEDRLQLDFSIGIGPLGRFRCNLFFQRGTLSAAIRMIPFTVPKIEDLGVPLVLKELCHRPRGLILITGPTGSGKSTTLAAMIQYINETRPVHILTIEDPIEFVFRDRKGTITQREVGSDTRSFSDALHAGLRQDPDIMVIGEMREASVIQTAITAAETGQLVISTLHTHDAKSTIERIVDTFGPDQAGQLRAQLASHLLAVVSQTLLPRADGHGRIPACEVLVKSPAIESYILQNELEKIPEAIAGSSHYYKMQSLNQDLERLVRLGLVKPEEALRCSNSPDDLRLRLEGVYREEGFSGGNLEIGRE